MLGSVGADAAGDYLLQGLIESGVNKEHINVIDTEPSGQAWITINQEGDNAIVILPGANQCTDMKYIESKRSVLESADIVLIQLEVPLETVCYAANIAKELGKTVILDPSPAVKNLPDSLIANTDYIKPNETELESMTGCSASNYQEGAIQLVCRGAKTVIVSLGDKGVYCYARNGDVIEKPAQKVDVVDTTAAGDGFIAAFALSLAKGKSIEESIDFAQTIASIVVTRLGAQASIPSATEIKMLK
jgi:ribokinase